MPQQLEDILEQNTVLQCHLFEDFDSRLLHIERTVVASADTLVVERLVERNNMAVVERIVLGTDTAVAVTELVDTHTDSFSVAFQAKKV